MGINDGFEKLVEMTEVDNDTDLSMEELNAISWVEHKTETSDFSTMTATTYLNSDGTIAKKVFSDGYTEYYYTA
jgi:hypothetical protein